MMLSTPLLPILMLSTPVLPFLMLLTPLLLFLTLPTLVPHRPCHELLYLVCLILLQINGILYPPLANYCYVQFPPIFRPPIVHLLIIRPPPAARRLPAHQNLTKWMRRTLAPWNCPTQYYLCPTRLHCGFGELTSKPVYLATLFPYAFRLERDVSHV